MKDTKTPKTKCETQATQDFPGVAVDKADDERVSAEAVKQETFLLNDNPQSDGE